MMPLAMARTGVDLRLRDIQGGYRLRQRLADLGLTPGSVVRVVQSEGGGPLIIALRDDARLALGRGMAFKIMVEDAS
jgi:ferrous iron transport protein A